ncbi:hypothetical protein ACF3MZ_09050 [Paenibacillaceae bacterium WGS1546]|uniref:hypothetical protein n=1 Tax=Cohnella sp. WGS1546 TaxID=3366810 RepID=UPI00372D46C9
MNSIRRNPLIVILSVLLIVLICITSIKLNQSNRTNNTETTVSPYIGDALRAFEFTSLDHYIGYADHIVYGKFVGSSNFDNTTIEYIFSVERQLKGDTQSKEIHVYSKDTGVERGGTYLLFLEHFEGGLYPSPVYKILDVDGLIKVDIKQIKHQNRFLADDLDLEQLVAVIQSSPSISKNRAKDPAESLLLIPDEATTESLITNSEVIAHIRPEYIHLRNKYSALTTIHTVKAYKGEIIKEDGTVILPSTIEEGKDYLVFLQLKGGMYIVTAKSGSVIPMSDEKAWNEALEMINE